MTGSGPYVRCLLVERGFVLIHQYINNGYHIVLDVNSVAVHVVDEIVYHVIPFLEEGKSLSWILEESRGKYPEEDIRNAVEECEELRKAGLLFTEDTYQPSIEMFKKRPTVDEGAVPAHCP